MYQASPRQRLLKWMYPLLLRLSRLAGRHATVLENTEHTPPAVPVYRLSVTLNDGSLYSLERARGRKLLLVNTASYCGYTDQYRQLQQLYSRCGEHLQILGFPSNNFQEQEKGSDQDIARFCRMNYGIGFPLVRKSTVVKGEGQHPVYQWLSHADRNGWNDKAPSWNFSKYLIDEEGVLTHYFDPAITPDSPEFLQALGLKQGAAAE
ncbi:MAG TPA: glutathione peroxidase [Chitinophagaceae bacterium]|jgi:glutathione peroxidase|nr:glutathione peroxidase [Chitinophagaceae bacterium]